MIIRCLVHFQVRIYLVHICKLFSGSLTLTFFATRACDNLFFKVHKRKLFQGILESAKLTFCVFGKFY